MPVFNEERYLEDSIESILSQSFTDFEFIIVNDGSTDGTQDTLDRYARKDTRIRLIANPRNLGVARSLNRALETAKGAYIALMDAGDVSHPERLAKQVAYLEENSDIYIVGTGAYILAENKEIIGEWHVPARVTSGNLYRGSEVIHPSIMVKSELFGLAGLYDEELPMCVDFEFYARALKHGLSIANLQELLVSTMHRESRINLERLRKIQVSRYKVKLLYLRYFFNAANVLYTVKSLLGCLLTPFFLKRLEQRWIRERCS
jgi:glycosyltransferase involved in cell wall biosynthesis